MDLAKITDEIFDNFIKLYWCEEKSLLREYYPVNPEKPIYSYLWGYGALLTTACSLIEANGNRGLIAFAEKCFDSLEQYRADRNDYTVYNSSPKIHGYGEPFYDDNAWVLLALLQMRDITKDNKYAVRAEEIARYLLHGINPVIGGVYWKEHDCNSSNTCSSAPTALGLLKLYEITQKAEYIKYAENIYDFVNNKLMDESGIYFDSLDNNNQVCKWQFSYNTGVMIWAGTLLYKITGKIGYKNDAIKSSKAAETFFFKCSDAAKINMLPKMPWFNVYLLQGLMAAEEYAESNVFDKILNCAEYAYKHARTKDGLFLNDWNDKERDLTQPYYSINLDTLGSAECFAIMLKWQKARRKNG